jgi:hypothetical protein
MSQVNAIKDVAVVGGGHGSRLAGRRCLPRRLLEQLGLVRHWFNYRDRLGDYQLQDDPAALAAYRAQTRGYR